MNIIFLVLLLIGVTMIVISQVLKHKGIWDWKNDDAVFYNPRGIYSPYELTTVGVIFFAIGSSARYGSCSG